MPVVDTDWVAALSAQLGAFAAEGPLAIAVSGGADSTALMICAGRLADKSAITVLTVDHGLRPQAGAEARQVACWAAQLGLEHVILTWEGDKPATGIQAAARSARYDLMTGWCREAGIHRLVTAHNLDDQAETVLMRLKRGSGVDGLAGMAPESRRSGICLSRPLLGVEHEQLAGLLRELDHPWFEDPSNRDEKYERIQIRKNLGALQELGITRHKLVATAQRMARVRKALARATLELLQSCAEVSDYGHCRVEVSALLAGADEVALRALARMIQAIGGREWPPSDEPLERLLTWLRGKQQESQTLGGCRLVLRGDRLVIGREVGRIDQQALNLPSSGSVMWDGRFQIGAADRSERATVGPLSPGGWAALRAERPELPAFVGQSLPAIRRDGELLAVPSIGYVASESVEKYEFSAVFANSRLISG